MVVGSSLLYVGPSICYEENIKYAKYILSERKTRHPNAFDEGGMFDTKRKKKLYRKIFDKQRKTKENDNYKFNSIFQVKYT